MNQTLLNPIRELNPQLLRELKGRLKLRSLGTAIAFSIISQFLIFQLIIAESVKYIWFDVFTLLSLSSMAAVLAIGTYMLIQDLDEEERRGTLNFLRLTPQSATRLFIGKLLGVPCLLYIAVALALPLQLVVGLAGGLNILEILGFDFLLIIRCAVVLSVAILIGLIRGNFFGLKPWLASAVVLMTLFTFTMIFPHAPNLGNGWDIMKLISPSALLPYFLSEIPQHRVFDNQASYYIEELQKLRWFYLPIGASAFHLSLFYLANYVVGLRLIWHGIQRLFHNPTATIISKRFSYWMTACFTMLCLGFSMQNFNFLDYQVLSSQIILLFLILVALLIPHRSTVQDWLQETPGKFTKKANLISELVWGEKSPAVVAIAINLGIASIPISFFALFSNDSWGNKAMVLFGLFLNASFILVCASLGQLMLLMKNHRRTLWTTIVLSAIIIVPPLVSNSLGFYLYSNPDIFMFSAFSFLAVDYASLSLSLISVVSQTLLLIVLNQRLTHKLKVMSQSTSKLLTS
ncbi:MAG: hypothetical protein SWJ54_20905 [Cyanobacteriota bacterium]|nr:hypothetical protein [Cyanobacteriota bacterium]